MLPWRLLCLAMACSACVVAAEVKRSFSHPSRLPAFSLLHLPRSHLLPLSRSSCLAAGSFAVAPAPEPALRPARRLLSSFPQMSELGKKSTAKEVVDHFRSDLKGRTAVVTGGNKGIGLETCKALLSAGCRVIMAARDKQSGEEAVQREIKSKGLGGYAVADPNYRVLELDLSDLASVKRFAEEVLAQEERVDLLVLNAGVMATPKTYTKSNFELQLGVNHFGHFYLTQLLLPKMKSQQHPSRVVTLSSMAHQMIKEVDLNDLHYTKGRKYSAWNAYAQSKLANILFARGLHARLMREEGNQITSLAVHPGVIGTDLWRHQGGWLRRFVMPLFLKDKTIPQGAATTLYACLAPELEGLKGGVYLSDCKITATSEAGRDSKLIDGFWKVTEEQLGEVLGSSVVVF